MIHFVLRFFPLLWSALLRLFLTLTITHALQSWTSPISFLSLSYINTLSPLSYLSTLQLHSFPQMMNHRIYSNKNQTLRRHFKY